MTDNPVDSPILIRGVEADDWEDVAEVLTGANVVYHTLQLPYQSRDKIRERMENPRENNYGLVAVIDELVVGLLNLEVGTGRQAHAARLGMMVHAGYQGQGVGSALLQAAIALAEDWLAVRRIQLEVFVDNETGVALYQKCGFVIEGTLHDFAFRDGRYVDSYVMARIRDEQSHD